MQDTMQQVQPMSDDQARMPRAMTSPRTRFAVFGAVAVVLIGALYLMAVRGEALLLDLQQVGGRVWCF